MRIITREENHMWRVDHLEDLQELVVVGVDRRDELLRLGGRLPGRGANVRNELPGQI